MVGKSSDIRSYASNSLLGYTSQAGLFRSELLSSLKEIRFSDQKFAASTPVSNIKKNHFGFQNNNLFYSLYDQLDYGLDKYFAKSETIKNNINKFVSEL